MANRGGSKTVKVRMHVAQCCSVMLATAGAAHEMNRLELAHHGSTAETETDYSHLTYAYARNKPIYVMHPADDTPIMNLANGAPSFAELTEFLNQP